MPAAASGQSSDLGIDLTDSADPVTVGTEFTYAIGVFNGGPDTATGVETTDTLPNEVGFVSATASQGACELQGSKRVNCELGSIASGASASIAIRVRAENEGTVTNAASVAGTTADPVAANDEDSEQTTIVGAGAGAECAGKAVTILGTTGADSLSGTKKRDVISGLGGDDVITGLEGNDVLCGGRGDDVIKGGDGADVIKGGGGDDRIRGGDGDDTLRGNGAADKMGGGPGDDVLKGGRGKDRCRGGSGRDTRRGCE